MVVLCLSATAAAVAAVAAAAGIAKTTPLPKSRNDYS
jgi:hypothetical protein